MLGIVDELIGKLPGKPIMVLSDHNDAFAWEAIRRGVRAYIPTTLDHTMTTAAFEVVMAGGYFVPVEMLIDSSRPAGGERPDVQLLRASATLAGDGHGAQAPIKAPVPSLNDKPMGVLTCREAEVLARIQEGKPNKVIAYELKIRESTVKVHVGHLMRKLNVSNRTQLAVRG
jgi:DNA-binding NarL/FixJ family response regulator